MSRCRRTHRMVIKKDDFDVANRSGSVMKADSDEGCYSGENGLTNGNNDADEEVSSFFANQILGSISRLLSANSQADGKRAASTAIDNSSESDEIPSVFENIFHEHVESPFNETGANDLDGPKAKRARDDLGNAREDWPTKESGSSMTIPMPMCIRLVELYRRCRAFLRTFSQKKEDRKARHQMWDAIDARLFEEFGIHSGVNRLKKKIQNIQAGARGKIEALRRETSNGIVPQDTNIRFTPAEMEMVRMLYQNGDKVLNTVNENNEPFYMQLEALMRRESNDKKIQLLENGQLERSPSSSNAKPVIYPQMLINQAAQNGELVHIACSACTSIMNLFKRTTHFPYNPSISCNKKHVSQITKEPQAMFNSVSCIAEPKNSPIVSLFSKPFDVLSAATHFPKTDTVPSSNGGHELAIMTELIARQINVLKRQEELQRRAELLFEQQLARESKIVDSIASLTKAASHLEQIGEFLLNTCRYGNINGGTSSPNNS
ncbi:unnamed protein product [Wuchereria bancrofti]|uniref:Myb/SANT-like DNA-binding domain-containing protein n=1 Tax=Wuchereria bancrofti TaxID=6293 RepID=A0A3P7E7E9_WUCBA|nr:unnamed protein product [Wuchereria bancrofti]